MYHQKCNSIQSLCGSLIQPQAAILCGSSLLFESFYSELTQVLCCSGESDYFVLLLVFWMSLNWVLLNINIPHWHHKKSVKYLSAVSLSNLTLLWFLWFTKSLINNRRQDIYGNWVRERKIKKELGKWCIGRSRGGGKEEETCLPLSNQP